MVEAEKRGSFLLVEAMPNAGKTGAAMRCHMLYLTGKTREPLASPDICFVIAMSSKSERS